MRGKLRVSVVSKQSGKIVLPTLVINGHTLATSLKLKDTAYYQIGKHGDYVQENGV